MRGYNAIMMKKICVVTGTRAEYGLLKPLIKKIHESKVLELYLVVTGAHLSPEFGLTYREIEEDAYPINFKIEMLLSSDTAVGISKSMAVALMGFADYFDSHRPDLVILLGDRYEMLVVAAAAMIARIPIAHIHGGELTEGAVDEAIRHSVTKMSQLHFTATESYRNRVIQLGEQPEMVFNVGSLGVESVKTLTLLSKEKLEKTLNFNFAHQTIVVTYHPVTIEGVGTEKNFENILKVITKHRELSVIFTKANADTNGRIINQMIDQYVAENSDRCIAFVSMGQLKYLSTLQFCQAVVGNSSSGLIEVPSFGVPTINIGDRQRGRVCADSVINCGNSFEEIEYALLKALSMEFQNMAKNVKNPYEGSNPSDEILEIISRTLQSGINIKKHFYDIDMNKNFEKEKAIELL